MIFFHYVDMTATDMESSIGAIIIILYASLCLFVFVKIVHKKEVVRGYFMFRFPLPPSI